MSDIEKLSSQIEDLAAITKEGFENLHRDLTTEIREGDEALTHRMEQFVAEVRAESDPVRKRLKRIEEYLQSHDKEFVPYSPAENEAA